jgi:hypothetical protein
VKGSHGARPGSRRDWPVCLAPIELQDTLTSTDVYQIIRRAVVR